MPEKIRRVKRRRRIRAFPNIKFFPRISHHLSPGKMAVLIGSLVVAFVVAVILWTYGLKTYSGWRESRLLKRASEMLQRQDFDGATRAAQRALELHNDSLPAYVIL